MNVRVLRKIQACEPKTEINKNWKEVHDEELCNFIIGSTDLEGPWPPHALRRLNIFRHSVGLLE